MNETGKAGDLLAQLGGREEGAAAGAFVEPAILRRPRHAYRTRRYTVLPWHAYRTSGDGSSVLHSDSTRRR